MNRKESVVARAAGLGLVIAAITVIGFGSASADRNRNAPPSTSLSLADRADQELGLTQSRIVMLDLDQLHAAPDRLTIPIADRLMTIELAPHSVRGSRYAVWAQLDDGSMMELDPSPERTVRGVVVGEPDSTVAGSIFDEGAFLSIILANGENHWVEPLHGRIAGAPRGAHVIYDSCDVIPDEGVCGVTELMQMEAWQPPQAPPDEGGVAGEVCKIAEIAIDADFQFYQLYSSSVTNVENRVNAVINTVNQQYENQVGIVHEIVHIIVRTSSGSNPYSSNNAGTLLCQFRSQWNSNHTNIQRDIAHLFTGRNLGSTLGVAWLSTICNVPAVVCGNFGNAGYSLVRNRTNFSCATDLSSHELGHNWSAQHCSCPSFTMNPSLVCANTFNATSINQIIAFRNTRQCLHNCPLPWPDNNTCPESFFVGEGATNFTNMGATTEGPNEPDLCNLSGDTQVQADVWFAHVAECTGDLTVSLCGSSYSTKLAIYFGTCPAQPGTAVACDVTNCPTSTRSEVTIPVNQGQAVRIRVGGHLGAQGNGVLTITCTPSAPTCPTDLNDSGAVDVQDLLILLGAWGLCAGDCPADLNNSGAVDVQDLLILLGAWGPCS